MNNISRVYVLLGDCDDVMAVAFSEKEAIAVCQDKNWSWRTAPVVRYNFKESDNKE